MHLQDKAQHFHSHADSSALANLLQCFSIAPQPLYGWGIKPARPFVCWSRTPEEDPCPTQRSLLWAFQPQRNGEATPIGGDQRSEEQTRSPFRKFWKRARGKALTLVVFLLPNPNEGALRNNSSLPFKWGKTCTWPFPSMSSVLLKWYTTHTPESHLWKDIILSEQHVFFRRKKIFLTSTMSVHWPNANPCL